MSIFDRFSKRKDNASKSAGAMLKEILAEQDSEVQKNRKYIEQMDSIIEDGLKNLDYSSSAQSIRAAASEEAQKILLEMKKREFEKKFGKCFQQLEHYFNLKKLGLGKGNRELESLLASVKRIYDKFGLEFIEEDVLLPYLLEKDGLEIASEKEKTAIANALARYYGKDSIYAQLIVYITGQLSSFFGHDIALYSYTAAYTEQLYHNATKDFTSIFGDDFSRTQNYLDSRKNNKNSAYEFLFDVIQINYEKLGVKFNEGDILLPYYIEMEKCGIIPPNNGSSKINEARLRCGNDNQKYALLLATLLSATHFASRPTLDKCLEYITSLDPNIEDEYKKRFGSGMTKFGIDKRFGDKNSQLDPSLNGSSGSMKH